jgi:hypothetical protein
MEVKINVPATMTAARTRMVFIMASWFEAATF